ncbi:YkgJ family cysteine cluster protein [Dokdonella sp.]|uniref:YkgJ family cysteine cluster protein n=1 Tax=Dokdonella sp. TaxID=2291710 RepID=UPI003784A5D0
MSHRRPPAAHIDRSVSCSNCAAVCCRLTVVLMPDDHVPAELIERGVQGVDMLKRGEDGWCVAVDRKHMRCTIYEQRPAACRRFVMGGDYCCAVREAHDRRAIPSILVD